MWFQSGDLSSGGRFAIRFSVALLIPAGLLLCLFYASQAREEATHDRNLRWLAQMATQISERVQIYSNFVRDRAEHPAVRHANASGHGDANAYSIEALKPTDDPGECAASKNLTVQGNGQERWLLFFQSNDQNHACAKSDLKELVEPTIRKDAFTSVVLAQREGRVLYQSGPDGLRLTDVSFLFAGDARPKPSPAKTSASSNDAPRGSGAPTSSIHITSVIGDEKFEIFVQPMPMRVEDQSKTGDWILLGISEKHTLLDSASPSGLMAVLPLVLLLVGMSWPLQRLWSMAPFEPMRRRFVVAVALCSLGVAVILSLLGVFEYSRQLSMTRADRQLTRFADALGRNFRSELQLAVDQLYHLDHKIAFTVNPGSRTSVLKTLEECDVRLAFEYADWIDGKGDKIIRWTTKETPAQRVNVSDRSYFRDAMRVKKDAGSGDTLELPGFSRRFAIEQVVSRTSGRAVTMLGIPSKLNEKNPNIEVASLAVNLVSLTEPVAPRDLGFAIIEPSGRVLFHSEPSRAFVENLFDECLEPGELRGIVSRRIQAFVDLDYAASPYRMYVTPIPEMERLTWTLVVFRKLSANRIGRIQVLVDASALLCVYGAVFGLAMAIAFVLGGRAFRRRLARGRPWTALEPWRVYVAIAGFVLSMIVLRAYARLHDSDLLAASIGCGVAFVLMTALGMRYCVGGSGAAMRRARPHAIQRFLNAAAVPVVLAVLSWSLGDWFMTLAAPAAVAIGGLLVAGAFDRLPRAQRPAILKAAWLVWGAELVLVVCIAPAVLLSKLSFEYEGGLRLRDSQFRLWNAEAERRKALERALEQTPGVAKHAQPREKLLAAARWSDGKGPSSPLYYYGTDTSRIVLSPSPTEANTCAAEDHSDSKSSTIFPDMTGALLAATELPNEERLMGYEARREGLKPARGLWAWREHERSLWLCQDKTALARAKMPAFDPFRLSPDVVHASSQPAETSAGSGEHDSSASTWMVLAAILALVTTWMNAVRRRMLLIGAPGIECTADTPFDGNSPPPVRLFLLAYPELGKRALPGNLVSYERIDLGRDDLRPDAMSTAADGLLLDRFEARFRDPKVRLACLEGLETALLAEAKPIAIRSTIDCVRYLAGGGSGDAAAAADENELKRWCMVLSHFERRTLPPAPGGPIDYAAIWDTCSEQERDVLMHLCRHGLVNPRAFHVVCGLLRRGLIRRTRDQGLRFSYVELREFVANATMMVSEKSSPGLAGKRLPAFAIGLLLLGVVLLFSQEELTTRLIGFLTTVTGGFETVRKQLAGTLDLSGTKKG